jgi:hypothetical protein
MNEELLPCPFCGNQGVLEELGRTTIGRGQETAYVSCCSCKDVCSDITYGETKEIANRKAAERWNRRPTIPEEIRYRVCEKCGKCDYCKSVRANIRCVRELASKDAEIKSLGKKKLTEERERREERAEKEI